jgi:HAD superfamily hydrolase (TIGR01484 family)
MTKLNKPLTELKPDFIRKNIKVITFDVDGVIVPTGTFLRANSEGTELIMRTHQLSGTMVEIIQELKKYFWINISSGRALLFLEKMFEDILWDNISLIAENGNFILINGRVEQLVFYNKNYFKKITAIRQDLKKLKAKKPRNIYGFEPKQLIITIHTAKKMPEIEAIVRKHDRVNELYCLWTGEGYDIGHRKTNKLTALNFLNKKLKIRPEQMIVTGNNLNDKEMLSFGTSISVDSKLVDGAYSIPSKKGFLGGEILGKYILQAMKQ